MTNEITKSRLAATTPTSRYEACQLVISGLESIRQGILAYHDLELTINDLYDDLVKAGWSKSKSTLKRAATDLRKEGLLPESPKARTNPGQSARKSERKPVENSTTTHPLPENSDESTFIECNSNSTSPEPEPDSTNTLVDVEVLQPCSGTVSFSKEVCSTQPEMDTDCPQQGDGAISMATEAIRQRDADFAELERLIECSHEIIQRHFDTRTDEASKFTEWQWRDLSQQYGAVVYAIDIRWQRLKSELAEDRADYQRRLDQCFGKTRDASNSTVSQLD